MQTEDLNDIELEFIYPTHVGCEQTEKDKEYTEILDAIAKLPNVAVINVINKSDESFHTLGFVPFNDEEYSDETIIDEIMSTVVMDSEYEDETGSYDPSLIFDREDIKIERFSVSNDLQKITEYLDAIYESQNFDGVITSFMDIDEDEFADVIISQNASLYLAIAKGKSDDTPVVITTDNKDLFEYKVIDNFPVLFSDEFKNVKFYNIGEIKTNADILNMEYNIPDESMENVIGDFYGYDLVDKLRDSSNEETTDTNGSTSDEGPSSEGEDQVPAQKETPVKKVVINTPSYEARAKNKEVKKVNNVITKKPQTSNLKEEPKMANNIFGKLNFKPIHAAITFDGLMAIDVNTNDADAQRYKAVDDEGNLIDVMDETIAMEMPLLMPVLGNAPEIGDFVQQGNTWYKILSDKSALNLDNGTTAGLKMNFTQFFKSCVFYRPMINPKNMANNGMMLAMMLQGEGNNGGNFDMKTIMMLSMMNGKNGDFMKNPMFLMFLMGDQSNGNNGFDMKTLCLMSAMNGNQNPFGNLFQGFAAPAAEAEKTEAEVVEEEEENNVPARVPVKASRRK